MVEEKENSDNKHALHSDWFSNIALVLIAVAGIALMIFAYIGINKEIRPTTLDVELRVVSGDVEYARDSQWRSATDELRLKENDQVRILGEGKAILSLEDGSEFRLSDNTHIALTNTSIRDFRILNESGLIYARVIPTPARSVTIQTDRYSYEALGTAFVVKSTETYEGVEVYQSSVDVRMDNRNFVRVQEGFEYYLDPQELRSEEPRLIELSDFRNDEFIRWNAKRDKAMDSKLLRLGLIENID